MKCLAQGPRPHLSKPDLSLMTSLALSQSSTLNLEEDIRTINGSARIQTVIATLVCFATCVSNGLSLGNINVFAFGISQACAGYGFSLSFIHIFSIHINNIPPLRHCRRRLHCWGRFNRLARILLLVCPPCVIFSTGDYGVFHWVLLADAC